MKKENFVYQFKSSLAPGAIFNLLQHIEQWWSGLYDETIKGKSNQLNDEFSFLAGGGVHYTVQKLVELVPGKRIAWLVSESKLSFLNKPDEWTGTKIYFDLMPDGTGTRVSFTHEGLTPEIECYDACSSGWTGYLKNLENKLN
jgi:hypothetical protein